VLLRMTGIAGKHVGVTATVTPSPITGPWVVSNAIRHPDTQHTRMPSLGEHHRWQCRGVVHSVCSGKVRERGRKRGQTGYHNPAFVASTSRIRVLLVW
jgi:hypothetical protein